MARPKKHIHFVHSARDEAMLACDLYNERRRSRNLEGFIVHMSIAWLNLFHAICVRDGVDYHYRKGRRIERVDGAAKTWDLSKCVGHFITDPSDPVRRNISFFIGLRNRIEHHYTAKNMAGIEALVAGKVQALFLNFERTLVAEFGQSESLGEALRFPIFIGSITEDAVDAVKRVYAQVPVAARTFIQTFEAPLDDAMLSDPAYDFRIFLLPKASSKAKADLAVEFVDLAKLTDAQRGEIDRATVVIRDRHVAAANLNAMMAGEVVARVQAVYPRFTTQGGHVFAWKHFGIRPAKNAADPMRTDARYCVYDRAHKDYVYTEAWVEKLKGEMANDPAGKIAAWKAEAREK